MSQRRKRGDKLMRRILAYISLAAALAAAGLYTWKWGAPAFCGEAGPCAITVICPAGSCAATYAYQLVGPGFCRVLCLNYDPASASGPASATFQNLPPGEYRIFENGYELSQVQLTPEEPDVRIFPPSPRPPRLFHNFCATYTKNYVTILSTCRLARSRISWYYNDIHTGYVYSTRKR